MALIIKRYEARSSQVISPPSKPKRGLKVGGINSAPTAGPGSLGPENGDGNLSSHTEQNDQKGE